MLRLLRGGGIGIALVLFMVAYSTVQLGYQTATADGNETIESVSAELEEALTEARQNATSNTSGVGEREVDSYTRTVFDATSGVVNGGVRFGYEHPEAAWWYMHVSPVTVLFGLVLYAYGAYRSFKRSGVSGVA